MFKVDFQDIGLINYVDGWKYQEELHQSLANLPSDNQTFAGYLLFCEHPHVYTLGNSGNPNHLLINQDFLYSIQATYVKTNRGGDITYHGPGQIVGYPIFNLRFLNLGVKQYIYLLEESIIRTLKEFDLHGERLNGATGVWLDAADKSKARKICAIGVRVSKGTTMHGFVLTLIHNYSIFNTLYPVAYKTKA
jgi:lipoyl(octanoyl) transferase